MPFIIPVGTISSSERYGPLCFKTPDAVLSAQLTMRSDPVKALGQATAFALVGGITAFLLRPTDIFGHQLPLSVVLTRGTELHGLNRLLIPLAHRSFNEVVAGLLLGAILGFLVSALSGRR